MRKNYCKSNSRKAQSALEYALLITATVGALLAMQVYIKRSIQGRAKDSFDQLGEEYTYNNMLGRGASRGYYEDKVEIILDSSDSLSIGGTNRKEAMSTGPLSSE